MWSVPDSSRYLPKGRDRSGISTSRMLLITATNHGKVDRIKILYSCRKFQMMLGRQKIEVTRDLQTGRQAGRHHSLWTHFEIPDGSRLMIRRQVGIGRASKPKPRMCSDRMCQPRTVLIQGLGLDEEMIDSTMHC